MTRTELIKAIDDYAASRGIAPATVTSRAVENSRLYHRILNGGDVTTGVAERIVAYMAAHPVPDTVRGAAQ